MKLFDEWGNAVGEYTPQGGGIEGFVVVVGLTVVGFLFYAIYWVIKEWLKAFSKALKNHDLGIAFLCSIPICIVALVIVATLVGSAAQAEEMRSYEATRQVEETQQAYAPTQTQQAVTYIQATVGGQIVASDLQFVPTSRVITEFGIQNCWQCEGISWPDYGGNTLQFTITNSSDYQAVIDHDTNDSRLVYAMDQENRKLVDMPTITLLPNGQLTIYCYDVTRSETEPEDCCIEVTVGDAEWKYCPVENTIILCPRANPSFWFCSENYDAKKIYLNP